jgi:16S rRNA G966 N2-methylase RsmD
MRPTDIVVHLFSGSLVAGNYRRVDMNPDMNPDICCKSEDVDKHIDANSVDIVFADPPYSKADSDIGYKGNYPNKKKTIESVHKILKPGGLLVWLDTALPMFRKVEYELAGVITILISTNHRVRLVSIFRCIK